MDLKYSFCCIRQNIPRPTCKLHGWISLLFPDRSQNRKKYSKKPRFPSQEGLINDKAGRIQFMSWPLQSPGQAPQPSLMKASCCTTTHLKHELSLLFPRGWDAAASSGMNNCSFLVPGWTCNPSTVSLFKGFPCFSRVTSLVKCYSHSSGQVYKVFHFSSSK